MSIEILYEDDALILCKKPAGIATQTRRLGEQDMESLLRNYRAQRGEEPVIYVIHRLDQPVEGVMVFAKDKSAAGRLSEQVKDRRIGKYYYAVGIAGPGVQLPPEGTLADYIESNPKSNLARVVNQSSLAAQGQKLQKAVLEYHILAHHKRKLLLDITLHTGRHHQIRLQFASRGVPLLGDRKYGPDEVLQTDDKGTALALCAYRLSFVHPVTGGMLDISIEPGHPVIAELLKYENSISGCKNDW